MNKGACIVVGAGPGLGLAVAKRFGKEGYPVALLGRRVEPLEEHVKDLREAGIHARAFSADASDPGSLIHGMEKAETALGAPEVLIYNAAALRKTGSIIEERFEELVGDFKVNVAGALVAAQQAYPAMTHRRRGTILLTGGSLAIDPMPLFASLAIGKAGIRNLALSLAKELEPQGIHVATVTIAGFIKPGTKFDPDLIADEYWRLHAQPVGTWNHELVYQ
ncbi:SDR family NAD(P)-dependent oxidoreductase [Hyalangium rubrum]|uniref:SDR family NAD(P)-dependent oxidoreductase n=1 Tax=Hyalangium rubrum TaxID=3103134 RepID=A0ABU5HJ27_9BACT|nr:SDR family NAD(P)-dependent oxidoreductase [Hyalangium sp. s54d21]MDY7233251.1 SDR family NAD(P)-dependent oxidoreductase [Hyalangium sp. s54d21]